MMQRRSFLAGAATLALAGCRSNSSKEEEAIGPLLAPATLAGRIDDVKAGKIAVLYVGPDMLFGRGHVPGARKLSAVDSAEGRRALSDALAKIPPETAT